MYPIWVWSRRVAARDRAPAASGRPDSLTPESSPVGVIAQGAAAAGRGWLGALAARLAAEEQIHVDHADAWVRRLGKGTDDSHRRMQSAVERLAVTAPSLLEAVEGQDALESTGIYPPVETGMFNAWSSAVLAVTDAAGLTVELTPSGGGGGGGRRGRHTEHLAPLLEEMCGVFRLEPNASW